MWEKEHPKKLPHHACLFKTSACSKKITQQEDKLHTYRRPSFIKDKHPIKKSRQVIYIVWQWPPEKDSKLYFLIADWYLLSATSRSKYSKWTISEHKET